MRNPVCKVCGSDTEVITERQLTRTDRDWPHRTLVYYCCTTCGLAFHTAFDDWTTEEFQAFYQYPEYSRYDQAALGGRRDARTLGLIDYVRARFGLEHPRILLHGNGVSVVPFHLYLRGDDVRTSYSVFPMFELEQDTVFDLIVAVEVMEHWVDPQAELRWIRDHLRPGGVFCGSTCLLDGVDRRQISTDWHYLRSHAVNGGHCCLWTRRSIAYIADQLGFSDHTEPGPAQLRRDGHMPATSVFVQLCRT